MLELELGLIIHSTAKGNTLLYSLLPPLLKFICQPTLLSVDHISWQGLGQVILTMANQSILRIARVRNILLSVSIVQLTRACRISSRCRTVQTCVSISVPTASAAVLIKQLSPCRLRIQICAKFVLSSWAHRIRRMNLVSTRCVCVCCCVVCNLSSEAHNQDCLVVRYWVFRW